MSPFDPTKPCQYRCGEVPLSVFVPTCKRKHRWIGVLSLRVNEECIKHYTDGRLFQSVENDYDLINIPEKRTISIWAVISAEGDVIVVTKEKPCDPMFAAAGQVVELTKEVELRCQDQ